MISEYPGSHSTRRCTKSSSRTRASWLDTRLISLRCTSTLQKPHRGFSIPEMSMRCSTPFCPNLSRPWIRFSRLRPSLCTSCRSRIARNGYRSVSQLGFGCLADESVPFVVRLQQWSLGRSGVRPDGSARYRPRRPGPFRPVSDRQGASCAIQHRRARSEEP